MFVIGRWTNDRFVEGETLAGYLYMEKSKDKKGELGAKDIGMKKFDFDTPLLKKFIKFLQHSGSNS